MDIRKKIQRAPLLLVCSFLLNGIISSLNYLFIDMDIIYIYPILAALFINGVISIFIAAKFNDALHYSKKAKRHSRKVLISTREMLILFWSISVLGNVIIYLGGFEIDETLIFTVSVTLGISAIYIVVNKSLFEDLNIKNENFSDEVIISTGTEYNDSVVINPITGAPMISNIDTLGNPYGMDNDQDYNNNENYHHYDNYDHHRDDR